jgi:hypothetical protein
MVVVVVVVVLFQLELLVCNWKEPFNFYHWNLKFGGHLLMVPRPGLKIWDKALFPITGFFLFLQVSVVSWLPFSLCSHIALIPMIRSYQFVQISAWILETCQISFVWAFLPLTLINDDSSLCIDVAEIGLQGQDIRFPKWTMQRLRFWGRWWTVHLHVLFWSV